MGLFKKKPEPTCLRHGCLLREYRVPWGPDKDPWSSFYSYYECDQCKEEERKRKESARKNELERMREEWEKMQIFSCDRCGKTLNFQHHHFCPDCGAPVYCECGRKLRKNEKFCFCCGLKNPNYKPG